MKILHNYALNDYVRMLDGQWQGITKASDGCIYFFAGSHRPDLGSPFFRYIPNTEDGGKIELICDNISHACGEDPKRVPPQGKVHSEVLEHEGWLYFGTHMSDYSEQGRKNYTGGHLLGYELTSGRLRDYGVIHPNYTNYSGVGLDRRHGKAYFYANPFHNGPEVDGPHLHRIDLATGKNEDMGLVLPWTVRSNGDSKIGDGKDNLHGQPCAYLHVDSRGDCWFTMRHGDDQEAGLFVARASSGSIERYRDALPAGMTHWHVMTPLDADRALVLMDDGMWIFDPTRYGTAQEDRVFDRLKEVTVNGMIWTKIAAAGDRFYWAARDDNDRSNTKFPVMRLFSASLSDLEPTVDHGPIQDEQGRVPRGIGGLVPTPEGRVYLVGRWHVTSAEEKTIGVDRHGNIVAAFFTELDVSQDWE